MGRVGTFRSKQTVMCCGVLHYTTEPSEDPSPEVPLLKGDAGA